MQINGLFSVMKELMILSFFNSMFCILILFILRSHNLAKLLFLKGRKTQLVFGFLLRQWWFSMTKYEYEQLRQFTWKIKHDKRLQVFVRIQKIKILPLVKNLNFGHVPLMFPLTHFQPMFHFNRSGTMVENGLINCNTNTEERKPN